MMKNNTIKTAVIKTLIVASATIALSTQVTAATRSTSYTYYDIAPKQGLLHTIDGPRTDVTDITTLDYDNYGNLTLVTNALGHSSQIIAHDASGRPLEMLNSNDLHTTFQYDVRGRLIQSSVFPEGEVEANGRITSYTYTPAGDIETITVPGGETLTYTYDDARRLIQVTNSLLDYIVYVPDLMGNILSETVHANYTNIVQQQSAVYNQLGQLFQSIGAENQTTEYGYDLNGNSNSLIDARLNPTTQAFDGLNRLKSVLDARAGTTDYAYDTAGNLNTVTDPNGHTTTYTYDGLGNLTSLNSPDTGLTTYNNYDDAGNLRQETNANNIVINYTYDVLNRLTQIQYPDSSQNITYSYDGTNYTSNDQPPLAYTAVGRRSGMSDSTGMTAWFYNAHGDLIQTSQSINGGTPFITRYSYQSQTGLLETMTFPDGPSIHYQYDTQGQVSQISTNINGQLKPLISNVQYQPFGGVAYYHYGNGLSLYRSFDLDGRLASQTIIGNNTIQDLNWRYNPVSSVQNLNNLLDITLNQSFDYDELDRLNLAQTDVSLYGLLGFAYDANGNRTQQDDNSQMTDYLIRASSNQTDSASGAQTEAFQYDAKGNITQHIRDGNIVDYHYNQQNRLSQIDKNSTLLATYQYNGLGQRTRKTLADGTQTYYLYTADGQLMSEIDATNTISHDYLYFDDQPLVLVKHIQQPQTDTYLLMGTDNAIPSGSFSVLASISNQTLEITLNDGQQLNVTLSDSQWQTSVNATDTVHTLNYSDTTGLNISGTITTKHIDNHSYAELAIVKPLTYQFTQNYQTSGIVTQLPGIATHYTVIPFDGLVIMAARPIESTQINIDINTKIVQVTYADGNSQDFQIAASDWLVSSVDQSTRYDFNYQQGDNHISGYLLQSDNETKASIDVQSKDESTISYTLPEQPNGLDVGEFYYYHNDHLGTPQLLTDKDQNIVWEGRYSPFGEVQISSEVVENNLRFSGQYFDQESGLHYNYFRYYDPSLGRYITSDPIGLGGGLNTYGYVYQNPLNWIDPFGLAVDQYGNDSKWDRWNNGGASSGVPVPSSSNKTLSQVERDLELLTDIMSGGVGLGAGLGVQGLRQIGKQVYRELKNCPSDGVKLNKQLGSQQQLGESGVPIAGSGTNTPLRIAPRLADEYGGNASGWAKRSSTQHTTPDGRKFETHWYENSATGQRVEPKTIVEDYLKGPK